MPRGEINTLRPGSRPAMVLAALVGVVLFASSWVVASSAFRLKLDPGQLEPGVLTVNGVDPAVEAVKVGYDEPFVIVGNPARQQPPYVFGPAGGDVVVAGAEVGDLERDYGVAAPPPRSFDQLGATRHLISGEDGRRRGWPIPGRVQPGFRSRR